MYFVFGIANFGSWFQTVLRYSDPLTKRDTRQVFNLRECSYTRLASQNVFTVLALK